MADDKSRREFLCAAGIAAVGIGVGVPLAVALTNEGSHGEAATGPRYAMVIDTRKCMRKAGCRECIDRCHELHNVPHVPGPDASGSSAKEEIKWVWKEPFANTFTAEESEFAPADLAESEVLVLCNQCDRPPCVRVCPTGATFRREDGIVMMDMHRCIGCRYCVVACPYGSRSFNFRDPRLYLDPAKVRPEYPTRMRGVVEKCTFCDERLRADPRAVPACVEVCPEKALLFGDLNDENSEVRRILSTRYTIRRKPGLGTRPQVFYVV